MFKLLAINCGDPTQNLTELKQTFSTGPSIPGPHTEGAYFQIRCIGGFFWEDLFSLKEINCSKLGFWIPFHDSCIRM